MSYYQKYRPQLIDELDLDNVRDALSQFIGKKDFPHAFLFLGPRGAGKTSAARILARVVNCEKSSRSGILGEPCNQCDSCKSILGQSSVDVIEMDAASHRGIDDIRDLREKIRLSPSVLRRKVYIIDEVHMLTNEAFNALLKTLEEPPAHAMFVLCTTEEGKVPETIQSRCTRIFFQKGSKAEVVRSLQKAVKGENLDITSGAIDLLADSVDGSFREGHKLLEQLSQREGKIDEQSVQKIIGLVGLGDAEKIVDWSLSKQGAFISERMEQLAQSGTDAVLLLKEILEVLQKRLHLGVARGNADVGIVRLIKELTEAAPLVKTSPLPLLPLEVVLLSGCWDNKPEKLVDNALPQEEPVKIGGGGAANIERILDEWPVLLKNLAPKNHSVAGLLRSAKPVGFEADKLIIEVFYVFHKDQLELPARRLMIEEEVKNLWAAKGIRCILGKSNTKLQQDADLDKAAEEVFGIQSSGH